MIDPSAFLAVLRSQGIGYFAGVPDSLLAGFCACLAEQCPPGEHLIAANEGGAVAAAIGFHLATGRMPLVYMQNSGLGNAVNPLLSLADPGVYAIPMLLLIGWRGEPGTPDEPQHLRQGAVTLDLLSAMGIPHAIVDARQTDLEGLVRGVLQRAPTGPSALVVRKGAFSPHRAEPASASAPALRREEAIAAVADALDAGDLVVATTGMISRELHAQRAQRGQSHARDFLVVGGMGHASQIAHALASHQPSRQVYCLDGDGALLMHMGALAIIGASGTGNFRHVVLNNGAHDSVGGQPTVAWRVDMPALARAAGYATALRVDAREELATALRGLRRGEAPALLEIRVAKGHRDDLGRPTSAPADARDALMRGLR